MHDPMRLYLISGEPPEVWIEGEVLRAWLTADELAEHDERWICDETSRLHAGMPAVTEDRLRSLDGGPRALAAWRAGDHSLRAEVLELRDMLDDTEQEMVDAMSATGRWDWAARRWGAENIERTWGPRPEEG